MKEFDIRSISENDIDTVARIMSMRWEEPLEWCREETKKYLSQDATSAGFCVYYKDQLVGTGLFSLNNEDVSTKYGPWLYLLWVEPEFRGNALGIQLTRKRMDHAKRFGYKEIYLDTMDAVPYHRRLGWQEIDIVQRNNESLIVMRWDLAKSFP